MAKLDEPERTNIGYVKEKELYVQFPRDATRGAIHFTVP